MKRMKLSGWLKCIRALVILFVLIFVLFIAIRAFLNSSIIVDMVCPPTSEYNDEPIEDELDNLIDEARFMFRGYFYEEALELLASEEHFADHPDVIKLRDEITYEKENLVLWEGDVRHIFTHSLVLYPEYLFPDLTVSSPYSDYFIFLSEFERILPQLLERGYVLYNVHDIIERDAYGNIIRNNIYLPPGRMPLIFSLDDPTLHYGVGLANRFLINEEGQLRTEVITPEGETIITDNGDVQLVLNDFVRDHPEFSWRGHKGIIAATGFMGIFGYDLEDLEDPVLRAEALAVIDYLKDTGWIFASHSHTHNSYGFFGSNTQISNIELDTKWWLEYMQPIVGETSIFIAPFGWTLQQGPERDVLINNGFYIYMNVDFNQRIEIFDDHVLMGRVEIGGTALQLYPDFLNTYFFDVESVIDPHRPIHSTQDQ